MMDGLGISIPRAIARSYCLPLAHLVHDPALLVQRGRRAEPGLAAEVLRELLRLVVAHREVADAALVRDGDGEPLEALDAE